MSIIIVDKVIVIVWDVPNEERRPCDERERVSPLKFSVRRKVGPRTDALWSGM